MISRDGKPTVLSVRPATPAADAGVQKGDAIATIDGKEATTLSLAEIRELLAAAPGTRVTLTLTAKGASRDVVLTLRDYV